LKKDISGILEAREKRWKKKIRLAGKLNGTVICIRLNIPGPDKTRDIFVKFHEHLTEEFLELFSRTGADILFSEKTVTADGPEYLMVCPVDAVWIKKMAIEFEDSNEGGRLADIDVMDSDSLPLSRESLGIPPRKCLLCNSPARDCIVLGSHDISEVMAEVIRIIRNKRESRRTPAG